ncbi:MAG: ferritin-like domain-containing protein [Chloroflexota bacterium]|nr:ferritin-like domain-containing protein [Chloroflexota bacterium]
MRALHERFLDEIREERRRLTSRRSVVRGTAKLAGGGALTFAVLSGTGFRRFASAQAFASDIDVLNYALTLEHLEATFYREGLETFGADDFDSGIFDNLALIRDHEAAHVALLTDTVAQLGGTPVTELTYDFGYGDDPAAFLGVAQALENTGVQAYDGAGQFLTDPELVTAAGGIVAVEARHASYLNDLNDDVPFPAAFEMPLSPEEVLDIATPFVVQ